MEESTGKSKAEILLPDKVRDAALAAAAPNPARPVEDILTGYEPVVAEDIGASPGSFEEAAEKWDADPDFAWALPANSNNKPQVAELFSNRDDADLETLEAQKRVAIGEIEQAIAQTDDDDNRSKLQRALRDLKDAKTPAAISAALTSANATLNSEGAGGGKAAGGDAERQQLWGEISRLNNEVRDILRPHMTEEERKQDDEFREAIRNARTEEERLEIQRRYSRWRQQIIDGWQQSGDPEKQNAAGQAQPIQDQINENLDTIGNMRRASQSRSVRQTPQAIISQNPGAVLRLSDVTIADADAQNTGLPRPLPSQTKEII